MFSDYNTRISKICNNYLLDLSYFEIETEIQLSGQPGSVLIPAVDDIVKESHVLLFTLRTFVHRLSFECGVLVEKGFASHYRGVIRPCRNRYRPALLR